MLPTGPCSNLTHHSLDPAAHSQTQLRQEEADSLLFILGSTTLVSLCVTAEAWEEGRDRIQGSIE